MPKIRLVARLLTAGLALSLVVGACGSKGTANESESDGQDPTSDTEAAASSDTDSDGTGTAQAAPDVESELLAIAEAAASDAGLVGAFYEVTLVDYNDGLTIDDYDHDSFLPETAGLVYAAEVERQLQGDTAWDWIEVVFYPDAATYLETLATADYATAQSDRAQITADSHLALAEPITPVTGEPLVAGQEPQVGLVPPPSEDPDDPPFVLVAAVEIVDQEALERHYASTGSTSSGGDIGARPVMWMDVAATLVGDEEIDSVRFNYWSSHSAFDAVIASNPDTSNREDGLGAAATMITLPTVDQFTPDPFEVADRQLKDDETAALYTPAAIGFLDATIGFSRCLDDEGQPWTGEPDPDDPDVDPDYLAALAVCAGELSIESSLVQLFTEDPEAIPVPDVPEEYTTEVAVAGLVAIDTFTSCLVDAGYGWLGLPGEAPAPDATANTVEYQQAMGNCAGVSGIQLALDGLLS